MATVDQKRAYNKLKHDLEPWRNFFVHLDAVLRWENKFYPAIIASSISTFFLILWVLDMSTVTLLSLAGLLALAIDFIFPTLSRLLFNPDNWTGDEEEQFERVCTQLCQLKMMMVGWYEYVFNCKERKSPMFIIAMSIALLALAYIGAVINNLLLMYFVTLAICMYPGVHEKQIFKNFGTIVGSKFAQMREKTKKAE